jgi:DNA repair exonuclease SbcCD ATPase subunit
MSSEQQPSETPADQGDQAAAAAAAPTAPAQAAEAPVSDAAQKPALASPQDPGYQPLLHHLYKAKALSERLLAVMSQREERLAEIKRRVSALEQAGGESLQPLVEAEANMKDAHNRMKAVLTDLGRELELAGVTSIPAESATLADLPAHTNQPGQSDEVAFLYKQLLLALGEWKAAQKRLAADRADALAKQVQQLRDQVAREQQETQRIRRRKEELERLKNEKQEELEAIKREDPQPDGDPNGQQPQ